MSKVEELKAEYEAAIEVAELEDRLVALKAGGDPKELREVKDRLRELRCVYRLAREGFHIVDGELVEVVDATASPATIETSAAVTESEV